MRTLKKTLCLVLAMTMVLGFFGVAFAKGASEYPDYDDVQYKEALDVMVGIDVIDGMGDDPIINPAGKVTRAQAAKMVAYAILGADVAKDLPVTASSFDDVNSYYDWAIPSIEYLVERGILYGRSGVGGNYDPEGEVTAYEVAKMMLCAAGYGENNEYKGDSWALNVAIDARKNGVFTGTKAGNLNEPATREECALYCFNGLTKVEQVNWSKDEDAYKPADGNDFKTEPNPIAKDVYPTLEKVKDGTDYYGRPAVTWEYNNDKISAVSATPVLTYTESFVPAEAYKALKDDGYKFNDKFATVTNGLDGDPETSKTFARNTDETSGNGTVTEFFVDKDGVVSKMVTIKTAFLKVADIEEDDADTALDERSITFTDGKNTFKATPDTKGFDTVYTAAKALEDAGKEAGALVAINQNEKTSKDLNIIAVSLPTYEELKITSVKTTSAENGDPVSFVADGETYEYAKGNYTWFKSLGNDNPIKPGNTCTVYFDAYGYAVYADTVEEASNLGVVVDVGVMYDGFDDVPQVKLLGTDGKLTTLPVKAENAEEVKPLENKIVSFKAETGKYEGLYSLTEKGEYVDGKTIDDNVEIITGNVDFSLTPTTGEVKDYKADENTIFLVETLDANDKSTYTAYTGIKAVPSITKCDGITVYTDAESANECADVVFVKNATTKLDATDGITFIAVDSKPITTDDGVVFDAGLIIGPAMADIKQVQVTAKVATELKDNNNFLVSAYTEDNGVIVDVDLYTEDTTNKKDFSAGVEAAKNGIVKLGAEYHTYADDCMVWVIDPSETNPMKMFESKKPTTITDDDNDAVFWIENKTSGEVSAIYIIKQDPTYDVTAPDAISAAEEPAIGGAYSFSVDPATAAEGATVTVTVTCSTAPTTGTDTVTIKNGEEEIGSLTFTKTGNDTCTFTMPASDVALTAECTNA